MWHRAFDSDAVGGVTEGATVRLCRVEGFTHGFTNTGKLGVDGDQCDRTVVCGRVSCPAHTSRACALPTRSASDRCGVDS